MKLVKKALSFATLTGVLVALSCQTGGPHAATKVVPKPTKAPEQAAVHGMLLLGDGPVYLAQIPTEGQPHDYQILLEVELLKTGKDPLATYVQDRKITGEKLYTIVPEPILPSELFQPEGSPARRTFKANAFRGHFEHGGQSFLSDLTIKVKRVVMGKKFDGKTAQKPTLRYFVFGNDRELFAAHLLDEPTDFEHLLAIRINAGILNDKEAQTVRRGALLNFPAVADRAEDALKAGREVDADVRVGGVFFPVTMQALTDYYLDAQSQKR